MGIFKMEGRSKAGRDCTRLGATWTSLPDTGYTSICPTCGERGKSSLSLVGCERSVEIEDCDKCKSAPKYKSRFQRFYGTGGLGRGY